MPPKIPALGREAAEALALQAVIVIVGDDDLLLRFLSVTGCGAEDLRLRIGEPDFLGAVLDFVLEDDATVQKVADAAGVSPETLAIARSQFPGESVDWTP
ncbi:DUF3572 domain-containing protein [Telmatospirillum sp.]|uniref:DUF3572 domain-containing protein n=1 Tax=Telmatospirillum sp. TaxID=2079197 RepID=UPI00284019C5|nr:DUF3572 domain-containing protein [Telmatospirillum sp.]MDR3437444.1 DUF3572 domain-containing protein [Telmatospirillum sp.]